MESVVTTALITGLVELGKRLGVIPKGWEIFSVFILSGLFGVLLYWKQDVATIAVQMLTVAVGSIGTYEAGVKPFKKTSPPTSSPLV